VLHGDHGERLIASNLEYRWYRLWRDLLGPKRTRKREGHETDVYEDLIRVPLVVVAPDHVPAASPSTSSSVRGPRADILDLAGGARPAGPGRVSLLPAVAGADLGLEAFLRRFGRVPG